MSEDTEREQAEAVALAHMMGYADAEGAARAKVERLEARVAELEAAAQPFARIGWPAEWEDTQPVGLGDLTVAAFRRIRAALSPERDLAEQTLEKLEWLARERDGTSILVWGGGEISLTMHHEASRTYLGYHDTEGEEITRAEALALLREKGDADARG